MAAVYLLWSTLVMILMALVSKTETNTEMKTFVVVLVDVLIICTCDPTCIDVAPCSCLGDKNLQIDCSNLNLANQPNLSKLNGLLVDELILKNISNDLLPLQHFQNLKIAKLDLSNTRISNVVQFLEMIDDSLSELMADNANVAEEFLESLKRFSNLTVLSIAKNDLNLNHLPEDVFNHISSLKELDMSENRFFTTSVTINVFKDFRNLQILKLRKTNIDLKQSNSLLFLKDMTLLEELYLDQNTNRDGHIMIGALFKTLSLTSLKTLSLRSNQIILLNNDAFNGIENLRSLDLSNNILPKVPFAVTTSLVNLTHLDLSNNQINYIADRSFENLPSLKYLNLRGNKLERFDRFTFNGLSSLRTIDLSSNELTSGHFWVPGLRPLITLNNLNISFNKLKYIQNDSFDYTASLETLDISGNPISFTDTMFSGIEFSLKNLYIRKVGMKSVPVVPLGTLNELNILDLSDNNFTVIHDSFMKGIKYHKLFLQNMQISNITKDAFSKVSFQISVYLDNNNLTAITFIEHTECLFVTLSLIGNPLSCDCETIIASVSGKIGNIKGKCANEPYKDVALGRKEILTKLCPNQYVPDGHCSKTGQFISSSGNLYSLNTTLYLILGIILMAF